jgi:pseudouridine-5'-phosphate glycosidase
MQNLLELSGEVAAAKAAGKPVIALESTIISHGMPYPRNLECAQRVESIIRAGGAVPATCAVLGGVIKAGLSATELEYLAKKGQAVSKVSRRDLPYIAARKADGATTVAGTMLVAKMAGIDIMCTGGIGGVHRGAERTFDISADLEELSHTRVLVVCAGAKSILDLALTLEYLETAGVPVLGYKTDELPAFFTRESGYKLHQRVDSAAEVAAVFAMMKKAEYAGGAIVANPIQAEFAVDKAFIDGKIEEALRQAQSAGVHGKELTPYLLDKIDKGSGGKSLAANIELVCNNARVSAEIACELSKL